MPHQSKPKPKKFSTIAQAAAYCQDHGHPCTWVHAAGGGYEVRTPKKKNGNDSGAKKKTPYERALASLRKVQKTAAPKKSGAMPKNGATAREAFMRSQKGKGASEKQAAARWKFGQAAKRRGGTVAKKAGAKKAAPKKKRAAKKKHPKRIGVRGRRWRDANGNTYFSSTITVDGKQVHRIPFEYGYGEQYADESFDWLAKKGYIAPGSNERPWRYASRTGMVWDAEVVDVSRKKDL